MKLHNSELATTGAIKDSSRDNLHQELGLEHQHRGGPVSQLCMFYTFLSTEQLTHIRSLLPQIRNSNRHQNIFNVFFCQI